MRRPPGCRTPKRARWCAPGRKRGRSSPSSCPRRKLVSVAGPYSYDIGAALIGQAEVNEGAEGEPCTHLAKTGLIRIETNVSSVYNRQLASQDGIRRVESGRIP